VVVFFFQAEDGIRDFHVTGVQTCALPIYRALDLAKVASLMRLPVLVDGRNVFQLEVARAAGFTYLSIGRPDVYVETTHRPASAVDRKSVVEGKSVDAGARRHLTKRRMRNR